MSIADYWRSNGYPYNDAQVRLVKVANVKLSTTGASLSYPADQVFRLARKPADPNDLDSDSEDDDDDAALDDKTFQHKYLKPWSQEVVRTPRDFFVASEGFVLLSADWAQVEVRLLAHYSEDEKLIAAFNECEVATVQQRGERHVYYYHQCHYHNDELRWHRPLWWRWWRRW